MRRYLFVFLSVFTTIVCMPYNADVQTLVKGKLVDVNGSVIPFASITLSSNPRIGTVTNLMGEFSMQNISHGDILVVDHLGYERLLIPVSDILGVENVVYTLIQKFIEINEVVVTSNGVKDIIKEAASKINVNYPLEYPMAQGIFRKQMMKGDEYAFFGECDMSLIWNSFLEMNSIGKYEQLQKVSSIRISEDRLLNEMWYISANLAPMLTSYPIHSFIVRNDDYIWEIESISEKSGTQVMEINFKEKVATQSQLYGKVYISMEDRAVMACIYYAKTNHLAAGKIFSVSTVEFSEGEQAYSIYYKKHEQRDKWMLNYARIEWISDAKIRVNDFEIPRMFYDGKITLTYDYMILDWSDITSRRDKRGFEKPSDPFIKLRKKYPKANMSEFKIILPDYKF